VIGQGILAAGITIGGFKWTGSFTTIDLIAATTNALNGALLARRPDHYRNFTVVGILLMALLGGIGGGVTRDVILEATNSGDAAVNDCSVHPLVPELPFGGVGNSGMGKYHGRWGFEAFTNARGVLYHSARIDPGVKYPPTPSTPASAKSWKAPLSERPSCLVKDWLA